MAKKDDMDKLLARETRRRASVVSSIAGIAEEPTQRAAPEPLPAPPVTDESPAPPETMIPSVIKPARKETRTIRKQIIITSSLDKKLTKKLKAQGLSLNEVVHQLLENWANHGA